MADSNEIPLSERITVEIRAINKKIADLEAERHALQRVLDRTKTEEFISDGSSRRRNFGKLEVEQEIIYALRRRSAPVSSSDLLAAARSVKYTLKAVTFRTYLHRLKAKGLITNSEEKGRGYWSLVSKRPL
jgi:predicted HTH transcriptional regulator